MFDVIVGIVTIILGIIVLVSNFPAIVKILVCLIIFAFGEFLSKKNGGDVNG